MGALLQNASFVSPTLGSSRLCHYIALSRSPERARSWRCNLAASYVNHVVTYGCSAPECEFCLSDARILETLSQYRSVSRSPERSRSRRCNLAASYVIHVARYGFPLRNLNSGGVHVRILETLSQIDLLSCSPERSRSRRCNLAASYVIHVARYGFPLRNLNSGGVHVRILETLSQIDLLSCSPERSRSRRCNLAASYVTHVACYGFPLWN